MRPLNEIIVHCTATQPHFMEGAKFRAKVDEVRRWHLGRGWSDIGYHFLIDRDGSVLPGRPIERTGAHVKGHNTGTIGIALFGGHGSSENDYFEDNFTPAQDFALRQLLHKLQAEYGIKKVTGHNQYAAKACPGFNVPRWLAKKPPRKMAESTTLGAAGVGGASVITVAGSAVGGLNDTAQIIVVVGALVALAALAWIARERIRQWAKGVR